MVEIAPFNGVYYNTGIIGLLDRVIAPPYDVIDISYRSELHRRHHQNVIRLILGEETEENKEQGLYEKAADYFNQWLSEGVLETSSTPCIYVYEQAFEIKGKKFSRKGLISLVKLEPSEKKKILGHEKTLSAPKEDRLELMRATKAQFSQIFSLYDDPKHEVKKIISETAKNAPFLEARDDKGITNRLWKITGTDTIGLIGRIFEGKKLFIADGHHRYETALNYSKENPNAQHTMMCLVASNDSGLVVLPTHRVVHSLREFNPDALMEKLGEYFILKECTPENLLAEFSKHKEKYSFAVYSQNKAFVICPKDGFNITEIITPESSGLLELDVTVLHELVLEKILGITKEQVLKREKIEYVKDAQQAIEEVDKGNAQAAFLMNATKIEQVMRVANAGLKMPQKSTYFYPKIITGLIMRKID